MCLCCASPSTNKFVLLLLNVLLHTPHQHLPCCWEEGGGGKLQLPLTPVQQLDAIGIDIADYGQIAFPITHSMNSIHPSPTPSHIDCLIASVGMFD